MASLFMNITSITPRIEVGVERAPRMPHTESHLSSLVETTVRQRAVPDSHRCLNFRMLVSRDLTNKVGIEAGCQVGSGRMCGGSGRTCDG